MTQFSTKSKITSNWVIFTVPFSPLSPLLSEVVLAASDMIVSGELGGLHKRLVSAKRAPVCLHTFRRAIIQITSLSWQRFFQAKMNLIGAAACFPVPLLIWQHQPRAVGPPPAWAGRWRHRPNDQQKGNGSPITQHVKNAAAQRSSALNMSPKLTPGSAWIRLPTRKRDKGGS